MSDQSVPDPSALDSVVSAAAVLRVTSRLTGPERDLVSRYLGEHSEMFRRAYGWTKLLGLAFVAGPLLLLVALIVGFGGLATWVSMASINAAVVITESPAVQVYRVASTALDVAVGAYLAAREGGDHENG